MILEKIAEALRDDSILDAWCASNLGTLPNILIGIDELNPPDRSEYPLIALSDIETSGEGMGSNRITYTIPVSCGVMCDEITISDRVKTFRGLILVEEFRLQVAMDGFIYGNMKRNAVIEIAPQQDKPKKREDEASLTIYYADAGEDVWDIAKKYNTSPEKIAEENGMDDSEIGSRMMLLIPAAD